MSQIGLRIEAHELGGADQTVDRRSALAAGIGTGKCNDVAKFIHSLFGCLVCDTVRLLYSILNDFKRCCRIFLRKIDVHLVYLSGIVRVGNCNFVLIWRAILISPVHDAGRGIRAGYQIVTRPIRTTFICCVGDAHYILKMYPIGASDGWTERPKSRQRSSARVGCGRSITRHRVCRRSVSHGVVEPSSIVVSDEDPICSAHQPFNVRVQEL